MKQETAEPASGDQPEILPIPKVSALFYLIHLLVPAFLLADIVTAGLRKEIVIRPVSPLAAVAAISALWLAAGLGLFFFSPNRQALLQKAFTPLTTIYTIYFGVIVMEAFFRLMGPPSPIPHEWPPSTKAVTVMDPKVTPGVSGPKRFTTNGLGLRGPMPPNGGSTYKIAAIGASTTICANLDDSEEWPHLVMEGLNAAQKGRPVWVGNAGTNGADAITNLIQLQWLPGRLHVDMLIFLTGGNDLDASLAFEEAPTQAFLEKRAGFQGELPPGTLWRSSDIYPLYRRLKLFQLTQEAIEHLKQRVHPSAPPSQPLNNIPEYRKLRSAAPAYPLPDLSPGLAEYRGRILSLAKRCRQLEVRCLFLTQPTLYRSDLTPSEQRLLWLGNFGPLKMPKGYLAPGDMERAMDMYNRVVLDVCRQSEAECYDVAPHIPKDTSAFFDDIHFNEAGSRLMAQMVTRYLLSTPPFSPGSN